MTYLLPPLNALRSFEAAARHRSFTRAALELGVTAGAVGQQVRALELLLGVRLFDRVHTQLVLTESGRAYVPALRDAFERLSTATSALRPSHAAVVRLGVRAGVTLKGPRGLLARIESFRATVGASAAIVVRISQPAGLHALIEGKVDMAIDRGVARQPGYRCDPVVDAEWTDDNDVVVSPDGTADCPEVAALRGWLTAPARNRPASAAQLLDKATA